MAEYRIMEAGSYFVAADPPIDHTGRVTLTVTHPDGTSSETPWRKDAPTFPAMPAGIATRAILRDAPAGLTIRTDVDTARLILRRLDDGELIYDSALPILPGSPLSRHLPPPPEEP